MSDPALEGSARVRPIAALYAVAILLSAGLLFVLEPMVAKMLLPQLGGASSVWNVCLVFYQAALLAGYTYAHGLARLPSRAQLLIHASALALAGFVLPIALSALMPPSDGSAIWWLIGVLIANVGAPFFVLSATAPLLQSWFSARSSADPYFLYAASNVGSFVGLLAFPLILEPLVPTHELSAGWMAGFIVLAIAILACGMVPGARRVSQAEPIAEPISWHLRGLWVLLAFVPSSLLLGVTTFISTDIAAAPLLWVAPLALYLLTFVIAFSRRSAPSWLGKAELYLVIAVCLPFALRLMGWPGLIVHLALFFAIALGCHSTLAAARPDRSRLTEFYFFVSLGGVAGGLFNALLAPVIFDTPLEYPLVIAAGLLLRARLSGPPRRILVDVVIAVALLAWGAAGIWAVRQLSGALALATIAVLYVSVGAALLSAENRPLRLSLGALALLMAPTLAADDGKTLLQARSFFGVYRVFRDAEVVTLQHGVTNHGSEYIDQTRWREPLNYYARRGPIGHVFEAIPSGRLRNVAVIGLGTGALACYGTPDEAWTFFEIDPLVAWIARDSGDFHFLDQCGGRTTIIAGDGRVSMLKSTDQYDAIILDAFSSDSIPAHLLTREAFALYRRHLAPGGIIVLHLSNRYLDLLPVASAAAADNGMAGRYDAFSDVPDGHASASIWAALAERSSDLSFLDSAWTDLRSVKATRLWTDDYTNPLGAIRW